VLHAFGVTCTERMQTSVIRHRVADFLKQHPPFDTLHATDLLDLAASGRVKFHESEELIYEQGDSRGRFVWVIQQGRVDLLDGERLHDVLGAGDLLGLDTRHAARTATDVILYALDANRFEEIAGTKTAAHRRTSWLDAEPPPVDWLPKGEAAVRLEDPLTTRSAIRTMLRAGVDRVAVSDAVLTAADLALFCGRDPIRLRGATHPALAALARRVLLEALARPEDVDDYLLLESAFFPSAREAPDPALVAETVRDPIRNDIYSRRAWFDHPEAAAASRANPNLIGILANDTLGHVPPLTFYKGAVLDLDGSHRAEFDIRSGVLQPIEDAARVFALAGGRFAPSDTLSRLAAEEGQVFRDAAYAYRVGFFHNVLAGGTPVIAARLSRSDQRALKAAFVSIQRLLELTHATFLQ
jgi:hypothetical protein